MEMRRAVTTSRVRMAIAAGLVGAMAISASVYALPKAGTAVGTTYAIVGPDHVFASGAIMVAGSGEKLVLHAANPGEAELEITLKVIGSTGKVLLTKTSIVGPDFTANLSYDPTSTTTVRAEISFASEVSIQDDTFVPSAELRGAEGTKAYIGDFKAFEDLGL